MRSTPDIGIAEAIEVFARGWSWDRSRTHPYRAEGIGPAWVMRDAPRTGRSPKYRREEWVAPLRAATAVHELAREHTRGSYAICVVRAMNEPDEPLRRTYKELGYRLGTTEPMMVHPLTRIGRASTALMIKRVNTQALADRLATARRSRPRYDLLTDGTPMRQYVALDGPEPIGWVESITIESDGGASRTWCSSMFVAPEYRRRGVGRALVSRMLRDDRRLGAGASVLLASHTGAKLYPVLDYRQIGELLAFTPIKR